MRGIFGDAYDAVTARCCDRLTRYRNRWGAQREALRLCAQFPPFGPLGGALGDRLWIERRLSSPWARHLGGDRAGRVDRGICAVAADRPSPRLALWRSCSDVVWILLRAFAIMAPASGRQIAAV